MQMQMQDRPLVASVLCAAEGSGRRVPRAHRCAKLQPQTERLTEELAHATDSYSRPVIICFISRVVFPPRTNTLLENEYPERAQHVMSPADSTPRRRALQAELPAARPSRKWHLLALS